LSINKKYLVLDTLDFDYCNIDSFAIDFKNTPQLRALNLSHNKIQSLTFKYRRGSTLQYLNLSYNPMLQKLPAKLFRLKKLHYLSIKETAITESELVKLQKQLPHCIIEK
jgi:Leucine-rich repeat (LRR) protein